MTGFCTCSVGRSEATIAEQARRIAELEAELSDIDSYLPEMYECDEDGEPDEDRPIPLRERAQAAACRVEELGAEVERLSSWKASSLLVQKGWDRVADALGVGPTNREHRSPKDLGGSMPDAALRRIAELEAQRDQLAEALLPFVQHFEYHLAQAAKVVTSFPDRIAEGLQITEDEIRAARAALAQLEEK